MRRAAARPLLVVLTGPTGTGKSDFALALAQRLSSRQSAEIISVDSAQVYRGMDIGTAKPSRLQRGRVAHHLIDIRDPAETYSAGDFVRDARAAIAETLGRGHLPLLVGGTMLYLRALREGLALLPPAAPALRREIEARAAAEGWPSLHGELARIDAVAAARIAPQDGQRIQRALEVHRLTGIPISQWQQASLGAPEEFRWQRYALMPASRGELRQQLALRWQAMLRAGLVDEVRALYERGDLHEQHASIRAVGYRQLWHYCAGRCTLEAASAQALVATAQLAKRQLTWLRGEAGLTPLQAGAVGQLEALSAQILDSAGA